MPSITLRQLRDTKQLKVWLRQGKAVELCERGRLLGRIVPDQPEDAMELPDFAARRRKLFGKRILPGADIAVEARGRS